MLPKIGEPREALKAVNYPNMFGVFFVCLVFFKQDAITEVLKPLEMEVL